jgi:DNA integrity scanning protein DisA with diadenylate cyclase activity
MDTFKTICAGKKKCVADVLENIIQLAVEIAREGREGRKIGTLFVLADEKEVLKRSRPLILDPLFGHPSDKKMIYDPGMRETVKELAQLLRWLRPVQAQLPVIVASAYDKEWAVRTI